MSTSSPPAVFRLVDRHDEVGVLIDALDAAHAGAGGVVSIRGEAGIGKTRLARELVAVARTAGFRCAWGAGEADGGVPPLWPWQLLLTQLGVHDAAAEMDAGAARFDQFRVVLDALTTASAREPLLIVIDDAHAADAGALLLTRFVVRSLRAAAVLVVITARDDVPADDGTLDDIGREGAVIRPGPLSHAGVVGLLAEGDLAVEADGRSGVEPDLAALATDLLGVTGGNPWLVQTLLTGDRRRPLSTASMRSVADLRLSTLTDGEQQVLTAVAVLGSMAVPALVADVVGRPPAEVEALLERPVTLGVVFRDGHLLRLPHSLLSEAVLAGLSPAESAALYAAAANAIASSAQGADIDRATAAARHLLAAAELDRGAEAIAAATTTATTTARRLVRAAAYESAAALLRRCVALFDDAATVPPIDLVLDVAGAELASGDLRSARVWFRRVADAADVADHPISLARAALGLGGMWVHEHRHAVDNAAFMSLLERAISGLPATETVLSARLGVRLAAERVYTRSGTIDDVRAAVEIARATTDPSVIAEGLSLMHHTMLGPVHTAERKMMAAEVIEKASMAGDGFLVLMGSLWRTVDLVLAGDPRSERAQIELREHADALQVAAVLFVVEALDVMRLIRAGQFEAAEDAAQQCFERGSAIGDADAFGYLGAHVMSIRWLQHRADEVLPLARQIASSPTMVDGDVAYPAAQAVLAAMSGQMEEAAAALHRVMEHSDIGRETSSNWMVSMFFAGEAARLLGDAGAASTVYELMAPFAALPTMGSLGVVCFGSTERVLGVTAHVAGRLDAAHDHLERAMAHNHRLGNVAMAAVSEVDLVHLLLARGRPGDSARAHQHARAAAHSLDGLGLPVRARAVEAAVAAVPSGDDDGFAGGVGEATQLGSTWVLRVGATTVRVTDSIGVRRMLRLLAQPFVDIPAVQLVTGSALAADAVADSLRHDVLDATALRAYHDHLSRLRDEIDRADSDGDSLRASRLRDELDEVVAHLRAQEELRGGSRAFVGGAERARVAVRKSLTRVFEEVAVQDPALGAALAASLRTGSFCRFQPAPGFPTVWTMGAAGQSG